MSIDLHDVIRRAGLERSSQALNNFLQRYMSPSFGALPKLEVELLVLDLLEDIGAISTAPGVYDLVSTLKVTRTKARKLIYDRELQRLSESDLDDRVKEILKRPLIEKAEKQFALEVENPLVSDHLRARIKKLGYVTDGSFSPSIVRLSLDAVVALIQDYLSEQDQENVRQALIDAGAPNASFEALVDHAYQYMAPIIDGATEGLSRKVSEIFAANPPCDA